MVSVADAQRKIADANITEAFIRKYEPYCAKTCVGGHMARPQRSLQPGASNFLQCPASCMSQNIDHFAWCLKEGCCWNIQLAFFLLPSPGKPR